MYKNAVSERKRETKKEKKKKERVLDLEAFSK